MVTRLISAHARRRQRVNIVATCSGFKYSLNLIIFIALCDFEWVWLQFLGDIRVYLQICRQRNKLKLQWCWIPGWAWARSSKLKAHTDMQLLIQPDYLATLAWAKASQTNHKLAGESLLSMSGHTKRVPEASIHPAVRLSLISCFVTWSSHVHVP